MKKTKRMIAYHEAGHVAARAFTGEIMRVERVSIRKDATSLGRVTPADLGDGDDRLDDYAPRL